MCRDPRWGRCYESYSEDHRIVQAMTEIIPGLQGDIPANSRKGFPYVGGKYEYNFSFLLSFHFFSSTVICFLLLAYTVDILCGLVPDPLVSFLRALSGRDTKDIFVIVSSIYVNIIWFYKCMGAFTELQVFVE